MRNHASVIDNVNTDFLNTKYRANEQYDFLLKDMKGLQAVHKRLLKLGSSSSVGSTQSGSETSKEDNLSQHGKQHQFATERRHKNFQVKKKTELCKTYQLGLPCPYGNKCSFAHGTDELRAKVLVPTNYKTVRCKQFFEKGFCNFGPRCQFQHYHAHSEELTLPALTHSQLFETVLNSVEKESHLAEENYMFNYYESPISVSERIGGKRLNVFENSNLYC